MTTELETAANPQAWIPGDWGYIKNKFVTDETMALGEQGENIIHLGGSFDTNEQAFFDNPSAQFFGLFGPTPEYLSLQAWMDKVDGWDTSGVGGATLEPTRRYWIGPRVTRP